MCSACGRRGTSAARRPGRLRCDGPAVATSNRRALQEEASLVLFPCERRFRKLSANACHDRHPTCAVTGQEGNHESTPRRMMGMWSFLCDCLRRPCLSAVAVKGGAETSCSLNSKSDTSCDRGALQSRSGNDLLSEVARQLDRRRFLDKASIFSRFGSVEGGCFLRALVRC